MALSLIMMILFTNTSDTTLVMLLLRLFLFCLFFISCLNPSFSNLTVLILFSINFTYKYIVYMELVRI